MAAFVAACSGTGVDMEIYPPAGVALARVELWIAFDQCTTSDCAPGIGWTDKQRASGNIYFLRDEGLVTADLNGDRFVLHLESTLGNRDPQWVGVVGYDDKGMVKAAKVLRDVHIPAATGDRWKVYLHAVDPALTDTTTKPPSPDKVYRAHVWDRAPTPDLAEPTGCLVYQKWNDTTQVWDTEYFVPPSDPDCDGVPEALECNDYWYRYAQTASTCVGDMPLGLANSVCGLGGTACVDGSMNSKLCLPDSGSHFACLPDELCIKCSSQIPADDCAGIAVAQGVSNNSLPYFQCTFAPDDTGAPCGTELLSFKVPFVTATCGTPVMHYIDQPFTAGQSSLVYGSGTDQIKLDARPGTEACQIFLTWMTGTKLGFGADGVTFLLEVPYSNNTRAFYPIHVDITPQAVICGTGGYINMCQARTNTSTDGLFKCAGFAG